MIGRVVIADDEKNITDSYSIFLKRAGITDFVVYNDARELIKDMDTLNPAVFFLDLHMPHCTGEEILAKINEKYPAASVLIITGNNDVETAVSCMRGGAFDYLVKPIDKDRLQTACKKAMDAYGMKIEIEALRSAMMEVREEHNTVFHGILTQNEIMRELFRYVESVSKSSFPVLITGETGTGKELFAMAVHECSDRTGSFVPVNVSGLDDTMFSDTLFGHVKGAFTGADRARNGLLAAAEGGTLFLDEIGDLNESAQIKLLRLLQEKIYMPLGSDKPVRTNARIVAATNADLSEKMSKGLFRQDLMYRLSTHSVRIPPLRERPCDIPLLGSFFFQKAQEDIGAKVSLPDMPVFMILMKYSFPGNVRQLQSVMSDMAVVTSGTKVTSKDIEKIMKDHGFSSSICECSEIVSGGGAQAGLPTLKEMEQKLIDKALEQADGNVSAAARTLGLTRQALHKRLKTQK